MAIRRLISAILTVGLMLAVGLPNRTAQSGRPLFANQDRQQPRIPLPDEPISLQSDLVDILFTATDANNRFITDLTQDAIEVFEDGVAQPIQFFARNNEVPMVLALVIDFSGSQEFNWPKEREAAEKFFQEFFRWGTDYAAILTFRGTVKLIRGLTSNEQRLISGLRLLVRTDEGYASQGSSVYDAAYTAIQEVLNGTTAQRILQRYDRRVRRALILITDGHDTSSVMKLSDVIEQAQRANVMIFPIGISDSFRFADVNAAILDQMAEATGGQAFYPKAPEQLRTAFRQIADELSSQYIVAYYPTNTARDGAWRKVQISVKGRPNVTTSHRAGYYAPKR